MTDVERLELVAETWAAYTDTMAGSLAAIAMQDHRLASRLAREACAKLARAARPIAAEEG